MPCMHSLAWRFRTVCYPVVRFSTVTTLRLCRHPIAVLCGVALAFEMGPSVGPLLAQGDSADAATGFHIRAIHAEPRQLFLDPSHHTATFTLTNAGNVPVDVTVHLELGYAYFPGRDTALFPVREQWQDLQLRDTLIANPGPQDHFLGPWLSGLPARVHLSPGQRQAVTVHVAPPPGTPDGEYYARIMIAVTLPTPKRSSDTKQRYALPIKGNTMPPVRDSLWLYYRQGPQRMGVKILQAEARQDTSEVARKAFGNLQVVRFLIHYRLLGPTHFDGRMEVSFHGDPVPDGRTGTQDAFPLYRDGTMWWLVGGHLPPGRDTLVVRFLDWQKDMPPEQQVPLQPAEVRLPFEIH